MNDIKSIFQDDYLLRKIERFLKPIGYTLAGGSIEDDGDTINVSLDLHGAVSYGDIGYKMKEFLGCEKLVLDSKVY